MSDLISRQAAIVQTSKIIWDDAVAHDVKDVLKDLPSAQPEVRPIDYQDCSNAMLKMWMDNVVTDGEYNRIMDKLNAHWGRRMDDLISRQAAIECIEEEPSAQLEPLTDKEQRIFLAAMGREEKVCKQVDDECRDCSEPYEDSLVMTCHEIIRKVKGALWT